jgi:hypothetical protein
MVTGTVEGEPKVTRASSRPRVRLAPVGFWSYSRRDDEFSRGRLSQLRSLLLAEIQTQYGLDGIQLFQDVSAIPHGADWERVTTDAIDESTFFIPIVTPFYMQSRWCARETKMFETRERAIFETHPDLPHDRRRIFPLLWIDVSDIEPIDDVAADFLKIPQWCDFSRLRHRKLDQDEEVLAKVGAFAKSIVDVLKLRVEAPLTEEELARIAADETAARAREKKQRKAREEEAKRARVAAIETGRLAEAERQRRAEELTREKAARLAELAREAEERRTEMERRRAQREAERGARRAHRSARLVAAGKRLRAIAGSPGIWIGISVVGLLLVALLLLPGRFGASPTSSAGNPSRVQRVQKESGSEAGNRTVRGAAGVPPSPAAAPVFPRINGRWCVDGNPRNAQIFSGNARQLHIAFGQHGQTEAIRSVQGNQIVTNVATYAVNGTSLVIVEAGARQRLEWCG